METSDGNIRCNRNLQRSKAHLTAVASVARHLHRWMMPTGTQHHIGLATQLAALLCVAEAFSLYLRFQAGWGLRMAAVHPILKEFQQKGGPFEL